MPTLTHATYVGHATVFLHSEDLLVAIDPWLEGNPACPAHLKSPEKIDLIVVTHGHGDHASEAAKLAAKHGCPVVATFELANLLVEDGLPKEQAVTLNKGGGVDIKGLRVSLTQAFHSSSYNGKYAGEPCGCIVRDDEKAIYHTGDTCLFADITLIKESHHPKVGFFCAGDHFTMGPEEAARAAHMAGVSTAIPIHHGTFPPIAIDHNRFIEACQRHGINASAPKPGDKFPIG